MPPVGRVDVTAADAVGAAPIDTIELPADGGKPLAADWRNVAAMALANDDYRATQIDTINNGGPFTKGITVTQSTLNGKGITVTGNGTGSAVYATSGSGNGGYTGQFLAAVGSNAGGVFCSADGTGVPLVVVSGANGEAINATAGGGNKPAIRASGNGTGPALRCEVGGVHFNGTEPAAGTNPGANTAWAASQAKAWANITTDGAGNIAKTDDYNVSSVAISTGKIVITFARAFATANYAVCLTGFDGSPRFYFVDIGGLATGTCTVVVNSSGAGSVDPASSVVKMMFVAFGRQT